MPESTLPWLLTIPALIVVVVAGGSCERVVASASANVVTYQPERTASDRPVSGGYDPGLWCSPPVSQCRRGFAVAEQAGTQPRQTVRRGNHALYDTQLEAVLAFRDRANGHSVRQDLEYAASICQRDGRFYVGAYADGLPDASEAPPCFLPDMRVGDVHTHARIGNVGPSRPDTDLADQNTDLQFFVVSPNGAVYGYRGPDAANKIEFLDGGDGQ